MKILSDIPTLLSTSSDVEAGMQAIIKEIKEVLDIEYSAIYYISEENAYLKYPEKDKYFTNFQLEKKLLAKIYNEEKVQLTAKQSGITIPEIESFLLFPLKIREAVFGFICVGNKTELTNGQESALSALAGVASYAIKDSELSNVFKIQLKALQSSIVDKTIAVKTIKEQNAKILEADKAKNEFIANISHELRTPLNAIIGFSEVLSSKIFGELNEKQAEYINDIYTSGVHLLGMINEILDISKLESNAMTINYTNFQLSTAVNEVINVMNPLADKKKISVVFNNEFDEEVCADYQKVQQILYNLLSNAIKFTPEKGEIVISAEKTDSKHFTLKVKDSGDGIDKESQGKIFDKFVQLENTYTKTGSSTGLGLTITKKFVEMMNGEISINSEKGKGAEFIILLPIKGKNG